MAELIRVNNVYKVYHPGEENEVRALDGVSIRIDYGEFVAILGSSGSGKSTLMNMLGCLDTPTLGEYYLAGENVSELSDNKLSEIRNKQIGFIFQGYNLIKDLTALENVELPLTYRGMHKEERRRLSTEALERVELSRRMKHLPSQMSGGQQQRVAIARAVAARPPIIMADEPTGNLDSKSGAQVMKILKELNAEGTTVILITHDNEIAKQAKRVIRIHDGKVVDDYMVEEAVS
ncbi:ATP-binding cassette domain-containing protein [Feifania hominis]|uniref:ABC transporter ATP-binding protein n=1 Tax=Feifania hominis TaxID=2763660 RepID=A0A926DDU7_9FIRM|nr:ABC transporter ATP-binding protein [Feifania hominis]